MTRYSKHLPRSEPRGAQPISMTWPMHERCEVRVGARTVHLSPHERDMLVALMLRPGFVARGELIEVMWPNPDDEPEYSEGSVVVYILRLRAKGITIWSQRTVGYALADRHRHA